jgi:hypothetical protein
MCSIRLLFATLAYVYATVSTGENEDALQSLRHFSNFPIFYNKTLHSREFFNVMRHKNNAIGDRN